MVEGGTASCLLRCFVGIVGLGIFIFFDGSSFGLFCSCFVILGYMVLAIVNGLRDVYVELKGDCRCYLF